MIVSLYMIYDSYYPPLNSTEAKPVLSHEEEVEMIMAHSLNVFNKVITVEQAEKIIELHKKLESTAKMLKRLQWRQAL